MLRHMSTGSTPHVGDTPPTFEPRKTGATMAIPGEPADKQIVTRVTQTMKDYWMQAAAATGVNLSEFIREATQTSAEKILECAHPAEFRLTYPWSETCLKCGHRLRSGAIPGAEASPTPPPRK